MSGWNLADAGDGDELARGRAGHARPYFFPVTTGLPSLTQTFHPPSSALIFFTPWALSMSAARALVASSCHAQ